MGSLSPWHWLIVAGVLVLLFGAKKLPDAARSMGQSMRIIKAETAELRRDDTSPEPTPLAAPVTQSDPAVGNP